MQVVNFNQPLTTEQRITVNAIIGYVLLFFFSLLLLILFPLLAAVIMDGALWFGNLTYQAFHLFRSQHHG